MTVEADGKVSARRPGRPVALLTDSQYTVTVLRCAITDRSLLPGDEPQRRVALIERAAQWSREGIDLIQLRERDLLPTEIADLACSILARITDLGSPTRLLINGSISAAIESEAHGMHLPAHSPLLPDDVRRRYLSLGLPHPTVTVSCHTLAEIQIACRNRADAIFFAPVFGKTVEGREVTAAAGLKALRDACDAADPIPVYALGGVTPENAPLCLASGAKGIAGIRLFMA
jgi:thiamine-phosphate pyrophosphorylase